MLQPEHGSGDGAGFGAGEAYDTDAAAAGWGGDGDDGVIEVHEEIVAGTKLLICDPAGMSRVRAC